MKPLFFALAAAGLLSACSSAPRTPDYECALDDVKNAKCASMEDTYRASRSMNTPTSRPRDSGTTAP